LHHHQAACFLVACRFVLRPPDSSVRSYPAAEAITAQWLSPVGGETNVYVFVCGETNAYVFVFRHSPCSTLMLSTNKNSPLDQGAVQNQNSKSDQKWCCGLGFTSAKNPMGH